MNSAPWSGLAFLSHCFGFYGLKTSLFWCTLLSSVVLLAAAGSLVSWKISPCAICPLNIRQIRKLNIVEQVGVEKNRKWELILDLYSLGGQECTSRRMLKLLDVKHTDDRRINLKGNNVSRLCLQTVSTAAIWPKLFNSCEVIAALSEI